MHELKLTATNIHFLILAFVTGLHFVIQNMNVPASKLKIPATIRTAGAAIYDTEETAAWCPSRTITAMAVHNSKRPAT